MRRRPVPRERWSPANLGLAAWWTADTAFATLSGIDVSKLRGRIDGRSGVLIDPNPAHPSYAAPTWSSSRFTAGLPFMFFSGNSRLDESSNGQLTANQATAISMASGTNKPFSILMTAVLTSDQTARILHYWYSTLTGTPIVSLDVTTAGVLKITRRDDVNTFANLTGVIELGTCIRRIGATFDGVGFAFFVDAQLDNSNQSAGGQGAISLDSFRVGGDNGSTSASMYLADLALVQRAINRNEWLHYYGWSVKRWGPIQPPAISAVGSGVDGTASLNVAYPTITSANSGEVIFCAIGLRNSDPTKYPTTPSGWSVLYGPDENPSATLFIYVKNARSDGTESGTVTFTIPAGNNMTCGVMFTMRGVNNSPTSAGWLENATTAESDNDTQSAPTVSCNGYGRCAVAVVAINEDLAMPPFTGQTGGAWVESLEFRSSVGANFTLQVQSAQMPNGGAISGGSATYAGSGTDNSIVRAFAVVGV